MRKLLLSMLVLMTMLVIAACGEKEKTDGASNENESVEKAESTDNKENKDESIEVDKNLLSVEVTLPASMFEDQNIDDVIAQAKEDGVKEVIKNSDGSLTYKMSKSKHSEMMKEMQDQLTANIEEMKTSEDFVSIKDVTHNKSFSEFTMIVDKEAFENSFDGFAAFGLGLSGMMYQLFDGVNPDN
jgi:predicted small lipoprotein YifL